MKDSKLIFKIKDNLSQILALTENNIKLKLRYKIELVMKYISPILLVFMPIIILRQFFVYNASFYPWTIDNFLVYLILAYDINLITQIISNFPQQFSREKFWQTLPGLLIAPINRINLLLGLLLSHLILISVPFIFFLVLCYIFFPISIITFIFIIIIFLCITLAISGIGLFFGVFAISNESIYHILNFGTSLIIWLSCVTYPIQVFPKTVQNVINLNPIYYILELLRLAWIEDNVITTVVNHSLHIYILIFFTILLPLLSVLLFNKVFKKYGIKGY